MRTKTPGYVKIILGMCLGIVLGLLAVGCGFNYTITNYVKPFGTIFLNLLKLVAMPLIFFSLVSGISGLSDISKLSRIGIKTIGFYIATTLIAVIIGLSVVSIIRPGSFFPAEKKVEFVQKFSDDVSDKQVSAQSVEERSKLQFLVDIIPENIVEAASNNTSMLQVIFFAIVFGIAIILTGSNPKVQYVRDLMVGMNDIILKIVDIIMRFAPIGVFALMAALVVDFVGDSIADSLYLFKSLGMYALTVIIGIAAVAFGIYPLVLKVFAGVNVKQFFKAMVPAQLVAFSTSSSAATLPVTMEQVERKLGVHNDISSFVLPIGVTINMDGTSLYQAVATVFIAEVFGVDLTFVQMLTILLTATLSSIGSAGVPGAGIVMLIIVLNSVGLPAEGLALILAIDRPIDMIRTVLNVTGDAMIATVVAKNEGKLNPVIQQ